MGEGPSRGGRHPVDRRARLRTPSVFCSGPDSRVGRTLWGCILGVAHCADWDFLRRAIPPGCRRRPPWRGRNAHGRGLHSPYAGHGWQVDGFVSAPGGNMMASEAGPWPAMALRRHLRRRCARSLRRMLAALEAGEGGGGGRRCGRAPPIGGCAFDRAGGRGGVAPRGRASGVEDDPEPLTELARLLGLHDGPPCAGHRGRRGSRPGRDDDASQKYRAAAELAPDNDELLFWGLGLAPDEERRA